MLLFTFYIFVIYDIILELLVTMLRTKVPKRLERPLMPFTRRFSVLNIVIWFLGYRCFFVDQREGWKSCRQGLYFRICC